MLDMATLMAGYSGPLDPKILIVGEAWGADEEKARLPFVGVSGQELWRMLGEAFPHIRPDLHNHAAELCDPRWGLAWIRRRDEWLNEAKIGFTNLLNIRPPSNKLEALCASRTEMGKDYWKDYPYVALTSHKYLKKEYLHHLYRLRDQVKELKPNLVVAMGNAACWGVLGTTGINAIRGTTAWADNGSGNGVKVLPTLHPASLLYEGQWSNRPIVVCDLMKAAREAEFPEIRRPPRIINIYPEEDEVARFVSETVANKPWRMGVDVETSGGMIDTIGFARNEREAFVVPFGPHRYRRGQNFIIIKPFRNGVEVTNYWSFEEECRVWRLIKRLLEADIDLVFQNGVYDIQYLLRMTIRPSRCRDDTMLAWHSLFPELRKSLGFIGSVLTDESAWKELSRHKADTARRDK
jgi:uracil-DNA glycosylase